MTRKRPRQGHDVDKRTLRVECIGITKAQQTFEVGYLVVNQQRACCGSIPKTPLLLSPSLAAKMWRKTMKKMNNDSASMIRPSWSSQLWCQAHGPNPRTDSYPCTSSLFRLPCSADIDAHRCSSGRRILSGSSKESSSQPP